MFPKAYSFLIAGLLLVELSCSITNRDSRYHGLSISECPPTINNGVLHSIGEDVSPDIAEQNARTSFDEEHAIPDSLKQALPLRSLAACQTDDGRYFVAVGISNKDLDKQRLAANQNSSTKSLREAIAHSGEVRRWNQLCDFLRQHEASCQPLDQEAAKQAVSQAGGSVAFRTEPDLPSVLKSSLLQSLLDLGLRVSETEADTLTVTAKTEVEQLPITDAKFRYVRATITIRLIGPNNQLQAERVWEAKGGGLNFDQATTTANKELATKIQSGLISALFGEG